MNSISRPVTPQSFTSSSYSVCSIFPLDQKICKNVPYLSQYKTPSVRRVHSLHPEVLTKMYNHHVSKSLCNYYTPRNFQKQRYGESQKHEIPENDESEPSKPAFLLDSWHSSFENSNPNITSESSKKSKNLSEEITKKRFQQLLSSSDEVSPSSSDSMLNMTNKKKKKGITIMEFILQKKKEEYLKRLRNLENPRYTIA